MSHDAYTILGITKGANATEVQRAYRKALSRLDADTSLTDSQRKTAARQLDEAYQDLAVPKSSGGVLGGLMANSTLAAIVGIVIALAALGGYWKWDQARQAEERERVLAEQAEQQRQREVAERAERERLRLQEELRAQKEAEEKARLAQIEAQQEEMKNKQFIEDTRPELRPPTRSTQFSDAYSQYSAYQQERNRRVQEQRERYEDDIATARARAETERQRRFVEQRQREEEMARWRREANARSSR
ncbi:MAG: hypothetical protein JNK75_09920 [Betaproteobacteria bacterium]|nr:hypothetical protein [Betaproteobacteria bacterium]